MQRTNPKPTRENGWASFILGTAAYRTGQVVWQKSCLGEVSERKFLTPTSREDQQLVNEHLTKAVKRANACLLGQMRQFLLENGRPLDEGDG